MSTVRFYGHTPPGAGDEPILGRLIVVEGTDGVGRSTQIAMLQEWLEAEGYAVLVTGLRRSELAASGIDRAMRGNTLDALTLNLFYATDFWDRLEKSIIPAMRSGMVALIDRYIYSIIARARVRGVPARWLNDVFEFAAVPDRVLYLGRGRGAPATQGARGPSTGPLGVGRRLPGRHGPLRKLHPLPERAD